ncbi:MAG: hypothetical protein ABI615_03010 [Chthoniobacterales bacterium]
MKNILKDFILLFTFIATVATAAAQESAAIPQATPAAAETPVTPPASMAAPTPTTYVFDSKLSGSQAWATPANWSSTTYPASTDSTTDWATITSGSGALTITTPHKPITIGQINLTGSDSAPLTLVLGSDLNINTVTGIPDPSTYANKGSAASLVLDLNGHNYNAIALSEGAMYGNAAVIGSGLNMTIKSTGNAGGTFKTTNYGPEGTGNIDIQNNVTLSVRLSINPIGINTATTTFSTTSNFEIVGGNTAADGAVSNFQVATGSDAAHALGNLTIGDPSGKFTSLIFTTPTTIAAANIMDVKGNVSFLGKTDVSFAVAYTYVMGVKVAGNWTDAGGSINAYTRATDAGSKNLVLYFTGGGNTEQTLSINRTLTATTTDTFTTLTTFEVGDGTTTGNVKLVNPSATVGALYTAGSFQVHPNSKLNLGTSTTEKNIAPLSAGSLIIHSGATISTTIGAHPGYAMTDASLGGPGSLTLNTFNLEITVDGSKWKNGSDLVLMTYSGGIIGTPALGTVTAKDITYEALVVKNGVVKLTKVKTSSKEEATPTPTPKQKSKTKK